MIDVRIVALDADIHDRKAFTCGKPELDRYIQQQARQDMQAKANAVFVMTPVNEPFLVGGFYTLCGVGIDPDHVPVGAKKRLPRYPQMSGTLLGRLAIASSHQGQGLGCVLLFDALERAFLGTAQIGSVMVITDPLDDEAAAFYTKYGFLWLEEVQRMFIMMKTIEKLITSI